MSKFINSAANSRKQWESIRGQGCESVCLPQEPENNLYRKYEEKVRPCIDLIDSLRALGVEQDLALPAIAVIGDQSSGKSSVLEALSGVALPRGSGKHGWGSLLQATEHPRTSRLRRGHWKPPWMGDWAGGGVGGGSGCSCYP